MSNCNCTVTQGGKYLKGFNGPKPEWGELEECLRYSRRSAHHQASAIQGASVYEIFSLTRQAKNHGPFVGVDEQGRQCIACPTCERQSYSQGDMRYEFCVGDGCGFHSDQRVVRLAQKLLRAVVAGRAVQSAAEALTENHGECQLVIKAALVLAAHEMG